MPAMKSVAVPQVLRHLVADVQSGSAVPAVDAALKESSQPRSGADSVFHPATSTTPAPEVQYFLTKEETIVGAINTFCCLVKCTWLTLITLLCIIHALPAIHQADGYNAHMRAW